MTTTDDSWGGVICPGCHGEVFRILDGHCLPCLRRIESEAKDAEEKSQQLQVKSRKHGLWVFPKKKKSPTQ